MEIITIPISEIHEAAYNPRKDMQPDDAAYQALQNSMETFGYAEPVIWNRRTKNLIGGHQRLKILKAQGLKEIQVSAVDLSLDEEKAFNIALNKIDGQWDDDKLRDLLRELESCDLDLQITGFDEAEITALLTEISDSDFDQFFKDDTQRNQRTKAKMVTCPFCGKEYNL